MWTAKTIKIMPSILQAYPKSRFIMLTLTVRNCELTDLRSQLTEMHKAWRKLIQRKDWNVQGWIRTTEVTRGTDDTAHPHYHCLLMVKSSYFSGDYYISQERWSELWQKSLNVNYRPIVDVRIVRPKKDAIDQIGEGILAALVETIKYTVKPSDVLRGDKRQQLEQSINISDQDWLVKLTNQLHKTKAIVTGGILKEYFKVLEDEPEDLIHVDEYGEIQADEDSPRIPFDWSSKIKRYQHKSEAS